MRYQLVEDRAYLSSRANKGIDLMLTRLNLILAATIVLGLISVHVVVHAEEVGRGAFVGKSGHKAAGHVSVMKTEKGTILRLEQDFKFDGAPDPKLAFGRGGYVAESQFTPLKKNTGAEDYAVPGNVDVGKYDEVWIWCERYNVPLGVAKIK